MRRIGLVVLVAALAGCGGSDEPAGFDSKKADTALRGFDLDDDEIERLLDVSRETCEELDDRTYELVLDPDGWDDDRAYGYMTAAQSAGCRARWAWFRARGG